MESQLTHGRVPRVFPTDRRATPHARLIGCGYQGLPGNSQLVNAPPNVLVVSLCLTMLMHLERNMSVHSANNPGHYTWSPFVTKLELRLRLANISYQHGTGSPLSGPKGKIPYVELS
jgi:hypothetical protein